MLTQRLKYPTLRCTKSILKSFLSSNVPSSDVSSTVTTTGISSITHPILQLSNNENKYPKIIAYMKSNSDCGSYYSRKLRTRM